MPCANTACSNSATRVCGKCKVTSYCGRACQVKHWQLHKKSCRWKSVGTFDFLRLPKEIRDKIYQELFILRLSKADQAKHDALAFQHFPSPVFRQNALDTFNQKRYILPGGVLDGHKCYPFIVSAMGLLLANKQVHAEANNVLFSQNDFCILITGDHRYTFWNCENGKCDPLVPCYVMKHNFDQIKRVHILMQQETRLDDVNYNASIQVMAHNLSQVIRVFNAAQNNFDVLTIRYSSCCGGEAAVMMQNLEALMAPLAKGGSSRNVRMSTNDERFCNVDRNNVKTFFAMAYKIEAIMPRLQRPVHCFRAYGDLPSTVVANLKQRFGDSDDEQTTSRESAPASSNPPNVGAAASACRFQNQRDERDAFFRKLAVDNAHDPGMRDLALRMTRMPAFSPSVMDFLTKPPTDQELARLRGERGNRR